MSLLKIYDQGPPAVVAEYTKLNTIVSKLRSIGVHFEHCGVKQALKPGASDADILTIYGDVIERLNQQYGFEGSDIARVDADCKDVEKLNAMFVQEHTHDDFEIRFFVEGKGLFYLHVNEQIYCVLCEQGDLISVPANMKHWFDMGDDPSFTCIRFFTTKDGWMANYTGN